MGSWAVSVLRGACTLDTGLLFAHYRGATTHAIRQYIEKQERPD